MLADQHIVMYEDEENVDILAMTYVLDLTQQYREEQYKRELEEKQQSLKESWNKLNEEKNILDALSVDYTSVYYCNLIEDILIPLQAEKKHKIGTAFLFISNKILFRAICYTGICTGFSGKNECGTFKRLFENKGTFCI